MRTTDTQSSSKPRLQNDTLGEDSLKVLYSGFDTLGSSEFQQLCVDTVNAGGGGQGTKDKITQSIRSAKSPAVMLKKAQDFILAGMGLGV
jgi:hypothetical protein